MFKRPHLAAGIASLVLAALVLSATLLHDAYGQAAGAIQVLSPITRDLGNIRTVVAQATGTNAVSADQTGYNVSRVVCVFAQTAHTSSPSTTFTIYNKDAASGLYYTLITSAAITTDGTVIAIYAGAGLSPTVNVSAPLTIAAKWRVGVLVGGTGTVTGTTGCSVQ